MKIITYSPDGKIQSEEVVKVNIPDYLKHFDADYPILNLTKEESRLLNSRAESFAKTLLMDRLKFILRYDYELYKESNKVTIHNCLIKSIIFEIEEIQKLYQEDEKQQKSRFNKVMRAASKVACKWMDIEDYTENSLYSYTMTKDFLCLIEAISKYIKNKKMYEYFLDKGDDIVVTRLQNLESYTIVLDFFKRRLFKFDEENLTIDCSAFSYNLIKMLSKSIGKERKSVYAIMNEMESIACRPMDLIRHSYLTFITPVVQEMPDPVHKLVLRNTINKEIVSFKLKLSELSYIQSDDNAMALQAIRHILEDINICYIGAFSRDWKNDITTLSDTFVHNHKEFEGNWVEYEKYYRGSLKPQDAGKPYTPQDCYKKLVAINNPDSQKNDITFTGHLIQGLLWILFDLKERNDIDQQGLYETIYKFNYIKSKIRDLDNPLTRIRMYIEPIYDNPKYVKPSKKSDIEHLITSIFNSIPIDVLTQENPRGFKGGFNLTLVCNVLGYLQATGVLHGDGTNLDKYLGGRYSEANNIVFKERKHYINGYSTYSFFRQNKSTLEHHVKKYITPQD